MLYYYVIQGTISLQIYFYIMGLIYKKVLYGGDKFLTDVFNIIPKTFNIMGYVQYNGVCSI